MRGVGRSFISNFDRHQGRLLEWGGGGRGVGGAYSRISYSICFIIPLLRFFTILGQENAQNIDLRRSVRFSGGAGRISKPRSRNRK